MKKNNLLNGKFISKIGSKGQGPEEYLNIDDLSLVDDKIFIFDISGKKILAFSLDGNFLSRSPIPAIPVPRIYCTSANMDDFFVSYITNYNGLEKNKFFFFDQAGSLIDSTHYQKQYENPSGISTYIVGHDPIMYKYNGHIHLKELTNDTVFALNTDRSFIPLYVMNLGKYSPKEEERFQIQSLGDPVFRGKKIIQTILETDAYLFIYLDDNAFTRTEGVDERRFILYDKTAGNLKNVAFKYEKQEGKMYGKTFFSPKFISEDKRTLITFEAFDNIDNDDNPALILVTLK